MAFFRHNPWIEIRVPSLYLILVSKEWTPELWAPVALLLDREGYQTQTVGFVKDKSRGIVVATRKG